MESIWDSRDPDVGFEDGVVNISADGNGQIFTKDDSVDPICRVVNEPDPAKQCPNSKVIPVTDVVYKGTHALLVKGTRRSQVNRWGGGLNDDYSPNIIRNQVDLYCGMAMRLSPDFRLGTNTSNNWCYLAELHGRGFPRFWALTLKSNRNPPTFQLHTLIKKRVIHWTDTEPIPLDSWFTFIVHSVLKTEAEGGLLELWINRDPYNVPGPGEKVGAWPGDFKSIHPTWPGGTLHGKVYQNYKARKNRLWLDEMIAAKTLDEVVEFLRPTPTPPPTLPLTLKVAVESRFNYRLLDRSAEIEIKATHLSDTAPTPEDGYSIALVEDLNYTKLWTEYRVVQS